MKHWTIINHTLVILALRAADSASRILRVFKNWSTRHQMARETTVGYSTIIINQMKNSWTMFKGVDGIK